MQKEYTGLDIIKDYYEKKSKIKFLVVSADRKEDVIKDDLAVAGYIEKSFHFDYDFLYNEVIRIKKEIEDERYNARDNKYHNLAYIDLNSLFDEDELNTIRRN